MLGASAPVTVEQMGKPLNFAPHRRMGRAVTAILATTAAGVFGWGLPANAATDGNHVDTFNCVAGAAPSESGSLDIWYKIYSAQGGRKGLEFTDATWSTSPARLLNALRVDLEVTPGNYVEISPPWGYSSANHDDVSSSFVQNRYEVASWPYGNTNPSVKGWWEFANSGSPTLRVRCYGMGPGDTESDAAHNDTTVRPIK